MAVVPSDAWTLLKGATLAEQGVFPVAGGWLDQSQNFMDACDAVQSDRFWWKQAKKS